MSGSLSVDLTGKAALVTGASSGLGRHMALTLARSGAKVAVCARRTEALQELVEEIQGFDGRAMAIPLDVMDSQSVRNCIDAAETELGALSILVNNAGIAGRKPALETDEADWDRVIGTNLKGAWLVAQETGRHMIRLGHGGSIVNIASILGLVGAAQVVSYCASKAAVVNMTRALAVEWARHDIRVNAIAPGYIVTELTEEFLAGPGGEAILKRVPQRRFGEPRDLDGPLLLLASEAGRYMTGSILTVDGGYTAVL